MRVDTPTLFLRRPCPAALRRGAGVQQRLRVCAVSAPAHHAPAHMQSNGALNSTHTGAHNGNVLHGPAVSVTFRTVRKLAFGEVLRVVGSEKALGNWDCAKAPKMEWSAGDRWTLTLDLGPGNYEFKVRGVGGSGRMDRISRILVDVATDGLATRVPGAPARASRQRQRLLALPCNLTPSPPQVAIANGDRLVAYEDGPNRTLAVRAWHLDGMCGHANGWVPGASSIRTRAW